MAVILIPDFIRLLGGDAVTAILLSQIYYWHRPDSLGHSKLRVHRYGKWWIAKSAKDWSQETGLTEWQVRRAIKVLESKALVTTQAMLFGGVPTLHLRLCFLEGRRESMPNAEPLLKHLALIVAPDLAVDNLHKIGQDQNGDWSQPKSLTEITSETTAESTVAATIVDGLCSFDQQQIQVKGKEGGQPKTDEDSGPNGQQEETEDHGPSGSSVEAPAMATAKEILQQVKDRPLTKGKSVHGLSLLWKKHLGESEGYQKPLGGKELGQLKHVHKHLGDQSAEVLRWALENWQSFVISVAQDKGVKSPPMSPHVGFFCAHFEVATQLIAQAKASAEKAKLADQQHQKWLAEHKAQLEKEKADKLKAEQLAKEKAQSEQAEIEQMYKETIAALEAMKHQKK